jgi:hypothetical protein
LRCWPPAPPSRERKLTTACCVEIDLATFVVVGRLFIEIEDDGCVAMSVDEFVELGAGDALIPRCWGKRGCSMSTMNCAAHSGANNVLRAKAKGKPHGRRLWRLSFVV